MKPFAGDPNRYATAASGGGEPRGIRGAYGMDRFVKLVISVSAVLVAGATMRLLSGCSISGGGASGVGGHPEPGLAGRWRERA